MDQHQLQPSQSYCRFTVRQAWLALDPGGCSGSPLGDGDPDSNMEIEIPTQTSMAPQPNLLLLNNCYLHDLNTYITTRI